MTCPDIRIQPEPPPPAEHFSIRCRDCAHCREGLRPWAPDEWSCVSSGILPCRMARQFKSLCGPDAAWFRDAITGQLNPPN